MKIAILGAGALGSVIGGLLKLAGRDVELWDVNQAHIDAINAGGLVFDGPKGRETIQVPALQVAEAEHADVVILLTKTMQTAPAIREIARPIDSGAHVLTLQNGLGNAERLAGLISPDRVLYGCTMMPGRFIGPGHVASAGDGYCVYRSLRRAGRDMAEALACDTDQIRMRYAPDDTDQIVWQKAAFNCAMNSICALQGGKVGYLAESAEGVDLARATASEVVAVARAEGVDADTDAVFAQMDHALANHREHKPSMLQDMEAGRETEIESLCGEVARRADRAGIAAPLNKALAALVSLRTAVLRGEADSVTKETAS